MLPRILLLLSVFWIQEAVCHVRGTTATGYFYAWLEGAQTKCGKQQPITGWKAKSKSATIASPTVVSTDTDFASGKYTFPDSGMYLCCASIRCKEGGVCDLTMTVDGLTTYVAAFGTRNTNIASNNWASHSQCILRRFTKAKTIQLNMESTGGNDCIEETGWDYNWFNCHWATV